MLKSEIDRLRTTESVPVPSPQANLHIADLEQKLDDLTANLHRIKADNAEASKRNTNLERDVDEYRVTFSTLEEDLRSAESDKAQFIAHENTIVLLEEEARTRAREIEDLELAQKVKDIEISNLKHRLDTLTGPLSKRIVDVHPSLNIGGKSVGLLTHLRESCRTIEGNGIQSDEDVYFFLRGVPRRLRYTEEENERLKVLGEQARERFEKLKEEMEGREDGPPPEQLRHLAEALICANKKLSEKIETLNGLGERQHRALQRCAGPKKGVEETLVASLRKLLEQFGTCSPVDHSHLVGLAERMLDAMVGVGV
jgi:chromosome segregation ATPase